MVVVEYGMVLVAGCLVVVLVERVDTWMVVELMVVVVVVVEPERVVGRTE